MTENAPAASILVVDDDPRDLEATLRILREAGFAPESVGSGDEALELLARKRFDLVVTDIVMRGANGFEVVRHALQENPHCICITVTSFGSLESALDSLRFGAYSFAQKPLKAEEFLHIVRRGLEKLGLTKELILRNDQLQKLNSELESRVRAATAQLEEMNRRVLDKVSNLMEVDQLKSAFLGNVSHDLRSPLTMIRGYTSFLLEEPRALSPEILKSLQAVDKATRHMEYLVRQILEAAQLTSGTVRLDIREISGKELIEECAALTRVSAEAAGLELSVDSEDGDRVPFLGDRGRLLQVLTNLAGNACKYTPRGGKVALSVRRDGNAARFCVADTGPGIAAEHRGKIFDRFFQADTAGGGAAKGLGLGLNIAMDIVVLHGGRLWVESEAGKGSRFYFTIPPPAPPSS
ncbi:MAG: ATP-binding protein [Elusimicrobiota bacterium]